MVSGFGFLEVKAVRLSTGHVEGRGCQRLECEEFEKLKDKYRDTLEDLGVEVPPLHPSPFTHHKPTVYL